MNMRNLSKEDRDRMARELVRVMLERVDEVFYHKCMLLLENHIEVGPEDFAEFGYTLKIRGDNLERFAASRSARLFVE